MYYYIETNESIPATFGECLAGLLSTVAHNIDIRYSHHCSYNRSQIMHRLIAQDGCRIVNFYTKFPTVENKSVKDYTVSVGSLYFQESRTILFKLSLRKMPPVEKQALVQVVVR